MSNSDTPFEIANGRSLMLWVVPIALAPLVLPSWTVFLDATASTIAIAILAPRWFNIYAVLSLYVIAFISWMAARAPRGRVSTIWAARGKSSRRSSPPPSPRRGCS